MQLCIICLALATVAANHSDGEDKHDNTNCSHNTPRGEEDDANPIVRDHWVFGKFVLALGDAAVHNHWVIGCADGDGKCKGGCRDRLVERIVGLSVCYRARKGIFAALQILVGAI